MNADIGIGKIACYVPDGRLDNLLRAPELEATEELLRDKIGVLKVSRMAEHEETSDLAAKAAQQLFDAGVVKPDEIDCLMVVTQNPDDKGMPHVSARVHGKLGLSRHCAVFDVSLGCSGFVYGLSILKPMMQAQGYTRGLLITADPYSKIINMADRNTSLLFGDAAAATLLTDKPTWRIGRFDLGSEGAEWQKIEVQAQSGHLSMDGRAVLNFAAKIVPDSIRNAMRINNVRASDVNRYILHQGSRHIVRQLAKRLDIDEDKAPFMAGDYGNTISSSIPILLAQGAADADNTVVLSGFGVGLSWASTVLWRVA
ncbi:MAG: ketoacyl-ACP synthase III [Salinisphaeraceae bacterium]|nr:ketoacyl-ACP synthase III [Salinisphaeraceae bacterium]